MWIKVGSVCGSVCVCASVYVETNDNPAVEISLPHTHLFSFLVFFLLFLRGASLNL